MAEVKRPYDTRVRDTRTRRTKAAVVSAAAALFIADGYAATTMEGIADASSTAPATLYRLFGSKTGVLTAVLDAAAGGDDEPVALSDRPQVQALLTHSDPELQLQGFAGLAREVVSRLAPLQRILLIAAELDPAASALLDEHTRQRRVGQSRIAHTLAAASALRPDLTESEAADIVYVLMSPEVYRLMVDDRGWSPDAYESWLARSLIAQLLPSR